MPADPVPITATNFLISVIENNTHNNKKNKTVKNESNRLGKKKKNNKRRPNDCEIN